jgi:hypothetical protein
MGLIVHRVIGYHTCYWVRMSGGGLCRLDVTCDDWYDDSEVFKALAHLSRASTWGDVVVSVSAGRVSGGIIDHVDCVFSDQHPPGDRVVYDFDSWI